MTRKIKRKFFIGIDIGGTKIAAGLVDCDGEIWHVQKRETPVKGSGLLIYSELKKLIVQLLHEVDIKIDQVLGFGVGVPGVIDPTQRNILITPNIKLAKFPLADRLEKEFNVKVVLGNDVNLGLLGEKWYGIAKNANNCIGIFPGTGVGGGIIIDGKLILGSQGAAAELGHMIIDMSSEKKSAGLSGSLEALASRRAIERDIREAVENGEKTIITKIAGKKFTVIKSSVLARALNAKDPLTVKVINKVCKVIGEACISLRHILNTDMIVLGGGVIEACGDYIVPRVRKISNADPFFKGVDQCVIEESLLGDDAVILGSVALIQQALGVKINTKKSFYPVLKIDREDNVYVDDNLMNKRIYIRADGKIKKVNGKLGLNGNKKQKSLGITFLRKICKKNPRTIVVGTDKQDIKVTKESKKYLQQMLIDFSILPLKEAIKTYNDCEERKAIVVC